MSYSRSYSATISGVAHDTFDYPASENGGTRSVSIEWSEDVDIDIVVDTKPFDESVGRLARHVDVLTGTVIATEAAQVKQKSTSADRISDSVTRGFFELVRSEITQQMAAIKSRVDSLFLKLKDLRGACVRVQQTMQEDYGRITSRYLSVFEELDRETSRRVASLDEAAHTVRRQASAQIRRGIDGCLSTSATITAAESSRAQSQLLASTVRQQMNLLLQSATAYLAQEAQMTRNVETMLTGPGSSDAAHESLPILYLEADSAAGRMKKVFYASVDACPLRQKQDQLREMFLQKDLVWQPMSGADRAQVERFFMPFVESIHGKDRERDARIRECILRLWRAHIPATLPYS